MFEELTMSQLRSQIEQHFLMVEEVLGIRGQDHLDLGRFAQYRLSAGGILQGRVRQDAPWETVLAYCGGRIDGKGRCGCMPLILGVEFQCPACRKLICRCCGYCSESCADLPDEADH